MDLLLQIIRQPLDPDYAVAAGRPEPAPRSRWALAGVALVIGAMFAVAAVGTNRSAPALQTERSELIARIRTAESGQDELRSRATALTAENATLRAAALGDDGYSRGLEARIDRLDPVVGDVAVTGPGVLVEVDDATSAGTDSRDRVLDVDLQVLANGLWASGAEAVAINGHRLSNLTAIRSAGDAITVDYRSLNRPYRVEAIGDPRTLQARFAGSSAAGWWSELAQNRRMGYQINDVLRLELPADPGMDLRYAKQGS